jgi:hypothetical protein
MRHAEVCCAGILTILMPARGAYIFLLRLWPRNCFHTGMNKLFELFSGGNLVSPR